MHPLERRDPNSRFGLTERFLRQAATAEPQRALFENKPATIFIFETATHNAGVHALLAAALGVLVKNDFALAYFKDEQELRIRIPGEYSTFPTDDLIDALHEFRRELLASATVWDDGKEQLIATPVLRAGKLDLVATQLIQDQYFGRGAPPEVDGLYTYTDEMHPEGTILHFSGIMKKLVMPNSQGMNLTPSDFLTSVVLTKPGVDALRKSLGVATRAMHH